MPVLSSGRSHKSRIIGIRVSDLEPRRTVSSEDEVKGELVLKYGRRRCSRRREGGSVSVRVRERKRGLLIKLRTRPRWRRSFARAVEELEEEEDLRPAHWTSLIPSFTLGSTRRRFRRAKVRVWSSEIVVGGGVPGAEGTCNELG